jgi:hypothetical protein
VTIPNVESRDTKGKEMTYNGFKNYETWNVVLWINNDEGLYNLASQCSSYDEFVDCMNDLGSTIGYQTPDGVAWNDSGIDRETVNRDWVQDFVEVDA